MLRILKWVFGIGAVLIVSTIIVVYIILSHYDFNDLKPRISEAVQNATSRKLTIGGDINLKIGLVPSLILSDIKFQNAPWGSKPEMAKISRFELEIALIPLISGNILVQRFKLEEPDILIETDKTGKSNLVFKKPSESKEKIQQEKKASKNTTPIPSFAVNKILIEKGRLTYLDGSSKKIYNIALSRLTASTGGINTPVKIDLDGFFNKEPFNLNCELGPLSAIKDPGKKMTINMMAKAMNTTIVIKGGLKDVMAQRGIDLDYSVNTDNLEKFSKLAGKKLSAFTPLELKGHAIDTGHRAYKISKMSVGFGQNQIDGSIALNLVKKLPAIKATLFSDKLDLRPLFPEDKKKQTNSEKKKRAEKKAEKKAGKIFSDSRLETDGLRKVNADINLTVKKIMLPKLALNSLKTHIILKKGHLAIEPLKAIIGGGVLDGRLFLDPEGKAVAITTLLNLDGFEIGKMLKELDITNMIAGSIDVDFNLKGKGSSVAGLMAGLNGHTSIIMGKGLIYNKYVDILGGDLSSGILSLLNPLKEAKDYTTINCMVSRFDIKNGIAESTALVFDTDEISVVGEGRINLKTEALDLSLNPASKGSLGGFSLSLGKLAKPFKLAGTLAEPSLDIDSKRAAMMVGKAIGGTALFGPAGIAAALISKDNKKENPCLWAIKTATAQKPETKKKIIPEKKKPVKTFDSFKKSLPDVGKALKSLFGN